MPEAGEAPTLQRNVPVANPLKLINMPLDKIVEAFNVPFEIL